MAVAVMLEGAAEGERALRSAVEKAARALLAELRLRQRELSVLLCGNEEIRELNRDKATDVLSFPMDDCAPDATDRPKRGPLGDIAISLEYAAHEADTCGMARDAMVIFLLVHGFCHLLGHDHGEPNEAAAMRAEEDRLLAIVAPGGVRPPTPY
jgi:probable rRNA maturation factor